MNHATDTALIEAAAMARMRAYAPYSQFLVGAALVAADGTVHLGCNVENASYGLTQCAERVAVSAAVAAGHREFSRLALASSGGVMPCGACRQVLAEFCRDLPILLIDVDRQNAVQEVRLADIFPGRFELK